MKLALIGHGAIAHQILKHVSASAGRHSISAILDVRDTSEPGGPRVTTRLDDLLADEPDLVIECASHAAIDAFGPAVVEAGFDLMIVSIGALSDERLRTKLFAAAERSPGKLLLPAGAIGGIDALAAARHGGLASVRLRSRKPPLSWGGAPGVQDIDLSAITRETVIFSGSAGRAAELFPKNANVAATVALAGIGFEATTVDLIADPSVTRNVHELEAEGGFGAFRIRLENLPSTDNPKTSALTAMSIIRLIENRGGRIEI